MAPRWDLSMPTDEPLDLTRPERQALLRMTERRAGVPTAHRRLQGAPAGRAHLRTAYQKLHVRTPEQALHRLAQIWLAIQREKCHDHDLQSDLRPDRTGL